MKDFSAEWPVLTHYGQHEEIMKRLALYMDWGKVEEPEQADLLLEHYQKDVGRLIRTLTFARTPHYLMAGKIIEYADSISCPMSGAIQIMFFMYRQLNAEQGIPLGGDEILSLSGMKKLLDTALLMVERDAAKTGGLPCVACKEPFDTIPELLQHLQSNHPYLTKETETMTPQENESNGGEAQADASAGVEKTHEQIVAEAKEAEAKQALADAEGAQDKPEGDEGSPETADGSSETTEPEPAANAAGESPEAPALTEGAPESAPEEEGRIEPASDAPATETEMGAGSNGDADEDEGEPDARDEVEQPRVDEMARTNCISIIADMYEVTTRNHLKPKEWWEERLGALREFIATV
jgi:hypothetical protein